MELLVSILFKLGVKHNSSPKGEEDFLNIFFIHRSHGTTTFSADKSSCSTRVGMISFGEIINHLIRNSLFIFAVGAIIVDETLEILLVLSLFSEEV